MIHIKLLKLTQALFLVLLFTITTLSTSWSSNDLKFHENVELLKHKDVNWRHTAALNLGKLKDPRAIPHLIKNLKDPHGYARRAAAIGLGNFNDPKVIDALLQAFTDKEMRVRRVAIESLGNLKATKAVPHLIAILKNEKELEVKAAEALVKIGHKAGPAYLIRSLKDKDDLTRLYAVMTIGKFKVESAIPLLISKLRDQNPNIKAYTIKTLGKLKAKAAVPELLNVFEKDKAAFKRIAVDTLSVIKDERIVPAFIKFLKNENPLIKIEAARALGNIKDKRAIEPLSKLIENESFVIRLAVAEVLVKFNDQRAVPTLIEGMKSKRLQFGIAVYLTKLKHHKGINFLIDMMQNKNLDSLKRREAVLALGQLKTQEAIMPLINTLKSSNSLMRVAATKALKNFDDPRAKEALMRVDKK